MTNNSVSSRNKKISIIKVMKMVRNSILIAGKENLGKNKQVFFFFLIGKQQVFLRDGYETLSSYLYF